MGSRARVSAGGVLMAALCLVLAGCQPTDEKTSPFTGKAPGPGREVLAVKIDNVAAARPQSGLEEADIVYVEQVEAGLTRLLAIFSSHYPDTVGPVRSVRESDLELLHQFDLSVLAYSGAQAKLQPAIDDAPLYPMPPGKLSEAYTRSPDRRAPHNLYLDPGEAMRAAPMANRPDDIGFRFGDPPEGGRTLSEHTVSYPAARYRFHWSGDEHRWLVSMDGSPARTAEGERLGAPTVVVQYAKIRSSSYRDRSGNVSPYTETVGEGKALVLRNGRAYDADWSRPSATAGTTFTDEHGQRLNFAAGQVWVVLAPRPA